MAATFSPAFLTPAWADAFPTLTGRVVDDAHLLQPAQIAALDAASEVPPPYPVWHQRGFPMLHEAAPRPAQA